MNRKTAGLLMGVVVGVVTSLVVLLRGERPRRFLLERFQQLRGALPKPEHVRQYVQQAATRVSQGAGHAKGTAQQAMKKVKQAGSDLGEKAKQLTPVGK